MTREPNEELYAIIQALATAIKKDKKNKYHSLWLKQHERFYKQGEKLKKYVSVS